MGRSFPVEKTLEHHLFHCFWIGPVGGEWESFFRQGANGAQGSLPRPLDTGCLPAPIL